MNRNKLTKRFLLLSAALTMALGQSAFAGETVALNLDDAMLRAFQPNTSLIVRVPATTLPARAAVSALRQAIRLSVMVMMMQLK